MSSLKITPADVCEIGFASSGSSALDVVAHMINENGSFTASCVRFLVLGGICFGLGDGGECLVFSAVCFTKLLLPDGLDGHRKNGGLHSGQPCNFRQRFLFPCSIHCLPHFSVSL